MEPTPIPYELSFEPRDEYLYVNVRSETINAEIAVAYLTEVAAKCDELSCRRLIIERDVPVMLRAGDLFFVTDFFRARMKGRKVAFVNPHNTIEQDMQLAIIFGTNRGANYHLFDNITAAEEWLRDGQ